VDSTSHAGDDVTCNVAAISGAWEAFNAEPVTPDRIRRGGLEPVLEFFDPDVVFDATGIGMPGLGKFHGRRGVLQFWADWFGMFDEVRTDVLAIEGIADKVISFCHQKGRGIASGAAPEWEFAMVFTMRDAKVVQMETHTDLDKARRAAGLRPAAVPGREPL